MEENRAGNLKQVLESFRPDAPEFGEEGTAPRRAKGESGEQLQRDLRRISRANDKYFTICFGLLLLLFVGLCVAVLRFLNDTKAIAGIFAATGLSFMGIITQMVKIWKQKVAADMMLALAGSMRPQDFKGVVDVILRNYLK